LIEVTDHAKIRWMSRVDLENGTSTGIDKVFEESVPVGWSEPNNARFHPPTQAFLIYKNEANKKVILTVLRFTTEDVIEDDRIKADHLVKCRKASDYNRFMYTNAELEMRNMPNGCGYIFEPKENECPWCGNKYGFEPCADPSKTMETPSIEEVKQLYEEQEATT